MWGDYHHPCSLYLLDAVAATIRQAVTTENVSRQCQMSPGGRSQNCSQLRTTALKEELMTDPDHFLPQKNVSYRLVKLVVLSFLIPHLCFV